MALVKDGALVDDAFVELADDAPEIPEGQPVIVGLERFQRDRDALLARRLPVGVRLRSDEHPERIADDLDALAVVALEFPVFKDGRAYSYARILTEHYGYAGEVRAVGDVLLEQLGFMLRTGFNAFEIDSDDPLGDYRTALEEFTVWYQPTGDARPTAAQLRNTKPRH